MHAQTAVGEAGAPARRQRNPFDVVLEQLDRAAAVLRPDPYELEPLRHPKRQVIVSLPVVMDSGRLQVFTGYRVLTTPCVGQARVGFVTTRT
jgi:glutamate dehydrogenase (NAD(P)+)